jgi:hydrogenase nickel incorporation protein HypB
MCDSCGCGDPHKVSVEVQERILSTNDRTAAHNRAHFAEAGVLAVNLMGSPGAGKTAVLEATARRLAGRCRLGAIAGDLETERDAEMVHGALHRFPWRELDYLFVENVGNLVCPAVYDLGQTVSVVALSLTEGEDKPLKYPVMFRTADLVLLTKLDLLPHLDVRVEAIEDALARVMPRPAVLRLAARTGEGVDDWIAWLAARRASLVRGTPVHAHPHA